MRAAQMSEQDDEYAQKSQKSAPSFLQTATRALGQYTSAIRGPYGQYKSSGGGLVSTLQDFSGKVKGERNAAIKEETKAKKDFKDWESGLTTMLENGKKSKSDIKSSIAQSQEQSSQKQASLMEAKQ